MTITVDSGDSSTSTETAIDQLASQRIAIIMVGLPARGKSFIARNLGRYLRWIGMKTAVISVASLRNSLVGEANLKADFFDPSE